ncbi:uncharacterized protein ACBR49_018914 [Aulostomus maculatus]
MAPGKEGVSGTRPGTKKTGSTDAYNTEAAKSSSGSTEASSRSGGRKRRGRNAALSADSMADTGVCVRVLRTRGVVAGGTSDSNTTHRQKKPSSSRGKTVMHTTMKKPTSKRASKRTFGPKLSKSRTGKRRPPTRVQRLTPAQTCKPETRMETLSCGKKEGASKDTDNFADPDVALDEDLPPRDHPSDIIPKPQMTIQKSRRRALLQHNEVKTEESVKKEEEKDFKSEEFPEVIKQCDDVGDNAESPRKRGKQPKDDKAARPPKRRKKPPVQYVRCEIEGCGTVLAHPRYLQHHIKYQHLLKKKYVCDHPSCGRLFRLQKQLLRHAKHHTDQRDYICEYCARAFKSSHNLAVHRMIHTGEKPIQCEICGFTCRQKASLNWHMKKHDAEASYQFSCSICCKKFEKKDSVVAHKAKSHPEVLIAEALAANGGSVITSPTSVLEVVPQSEGVLETVPVSTSSDQLPVHQENQETTSTLTPLQQVVLPLAPQTQLAVSPGQFLQLPTHHMVQQAPTVLHLTTAPPPHLSSTSHPQLIQLTALPASSVTPSTFSQSTLLTLSSVTTLVPQQAVQWGREAERNEQLSGEGELWDRVVVGCSPQDVGEMMWEDGGEMKREDEGIVWENERQIMVQCAETQGDGLI